MEEGVGHIIRNGSGTHTSATGTIYCGQWTNDQMNGRGNVQCASAIYLSGAIGHLQITWSFFPLMLRYVCMYNYARRHFVSIQINIVHVVLSCYIHDVSYNVCTYMYMYIANNIILYMYILFVGLLILIR